MSRYFILFLLVNLGCNDLPDAPKNNTPIGDQLPTWDTITPSTHTKASRPPEPVLIVDRKANSCFKVYSIFPQEYRLPNGQAYSIRDCNDDCGTLIVCPGWAQDVQSDFTKRSQLKEEASVTPEPVEPQTETTDTQAEPTVTETPKKNWPGRLGPPPTEAPKEDDEKDASENSKEN